MLWKVTSRMPSASGRLLGRRITAIRAAKVSQSIIGLSSRLGVGQHVNTRSLVGTLMPSVDVEYYRGRALTERALAKDAGRADVAAIHEELARQYEALVERAELRPTLRVAFPPPRKNK